MPDVPLEPELPEDPLEPDVPEEPLDPDVPEPPPLDVFKTQSESVIPL